ncbi:helix-turn-helix domain-containing protein [Brucella sp. 22210]|uniref:helix-turn-helix domain-containing protein n=1 Tax=Brucella sp. 22210 TaxID=3453892 RepID=UPI003F87AAC0
MSALHSTKLPKPAARRLNSDELKAIAVDFAAGLNVTEIAAKRRVSRPTVYRALERANASRGSESADVRIYVRLSRLEHEAIKDLAWGRRETVAALTRRILRRASGCFDADQEIADAALTLATELRKVGTNLNQVVYQINREALLQGRAMPNGLHLKAIEDMR